VPSPMRARWPLVHLHVGCVAMDCPIGSSALRIGECEKCVDVSLRGVPSKRSLGEAPAIGRADELVEI
jgi:hypothetical protein